MKSELRFALSLCLSGLMALFFAAGCSSRAKASREDTNRHSGNTANPIQRQLDGGSYCVQTITQGPPLSATIHFSNKEVQGDGTSKDFESDLVGDKLDVTVHERHPATDFDRELNTVKGVEPTPIRDGFAESVRTNHYTRSDPSGWTMGANSVAMGGTPWGLFLNKPTTTEVGDENISGFDTVKYAVDTTHQSQMDKAALLAASQLKDYNITGTAWVLKEKNCILQYAIDFEQDERDGKISKTHYEGSFARQ